MPTNATPDGREIGRAAARHLEHIARRLDANAPTWRRIARRHITRPLIRQLHRI